MTLQSTYQFEAIGTHWAIETDVPLSSTETATIHTIIDSFDQTYSRFRPDSLVSRARAQAPGSFVFPADIVKLYNTYIQLEQITHGAVNPLVGDTLERLGYDAQYSLRPTDLSPSAPVSFAKTVTRSDTTLTYHQPVLLDIGAIGKGYLVDQVAEYVARHHKQYIVDAGGDIAVSSTLPYTIGLEHPTDLTKIIGSVDLQQQSICGSSPNRRHWGKGLHHIIDGQTGKPTVGSVIATWAIADTTLMADALATALFFVPAATLQRHFGDFHHVTIWADSRIEHNLAGIGQLFTD
jgi:FAD:protein FMN transferase